VLDGTWRRGVDRATAPVAGALVRLGVGPNGLTLLGVAMAACTAAVVGSGHLIAGILLLFPTGLPDLFDGPVAKASGQASARGAFLDSVADRVADGLLFGGVAYDLARTHHGTAVVIPLAILGATALVSYERSKAELLGVDAKGGLMERAERFVLLGACFLTGALDPAAFVPALVGFLVLVAGTAIGRFLRVWSALGDRSAEAAALHRVLMRLALGEPGLEERWRAWRRARLARVASARRERRVAARGAGRPGAFEPWRSRLLLRDGKRRPAPDAAVADEGLRRAGWLARRGAELGIAERGEGSGRGPLERRRAWRVRGRLAERARRQGGLRKQA
jgi:CDP-diacylglycerol--glycerol-3-phosphate 3-phosphatidyltransferase